MNENTFIIRDAEDLTKVVNFLYYKGILNQYLDSIELPGQLVVEYVDYTRTKAIVQQTMAETSRVFDGTNETTEEESVVVNEVKAKKSRNNQPWLDTELSSLQVMVRKNESVKLIAKKLGRTEFGVRYAAYERLAYHRDNGSWHYDADKAKEIREKEGN